MQGQRKRSDGNKIDRDVDRWNANATKEKAIHYADTVIGIEGRTTNIREAGGNGIIPAMWERFFAEGILQKIPGRIDAALYAVYSNYASDHKGEYSFLIGARVKDGTLAPSNMIVKRIQAGQYTVITSEKGPFPKIVPGAWQKIFALEDEGKMQRSLPN